MEEKKEAFKNYIEAYKKLDIESKREEYLSALKELIVIFDGLAESESIKLDYVQSDEIFDTKSEDDFLEAAMVYVEVAKDIIGQYLAKKIN